MLSAPAIPRPVEGVMRALHSPFGPDPATLAEWWRLRDDPVWHGRDLAWGNGMPVLLVPGFGAPSMSMDPLRSWFARHGYGARIAGVGNGMDCSERSVAALERQARDACEHAGRPVLIVAHSRGGQFARVLVARRPELAAGLVTLGTPFELLGVKPLTKALMGVVGAAATVGVPNLAGIACVRGECCERFRADLEADWRAAVPLMAVYTRADRTVHWRTCRDPAARNVEVAAGHVSMLVAPATYRAIAAFASPLVSSA